MRIHCLVHEQAAVGQRRETGLEVPVVPPATDDEQGGRRQHRTQGAHVLRSISGSGKQLKHLRAGVERGESFAGGGEARAYLQAAIHGVADHGRIGIGSDDEVRAQRR